MATIYGLCEPDSELRYVGKTIRSPAERRRGHIRRTKEAQCRQTRLRDWIRSLLARDTGPALWILEEDVPAEDLDAREIAWIAACRAWGCWLVNQRDGGDGGGGTTNHVANCACGWCQPVGGNIRHVQNCECPICSGGGNKHHPSSCRCPFCRQDGNRGFRHSQETIEQLRQQPITAETRARMSAAQRKRHARERREAS